MYLDNTAKITRVKELNKLLNTKENEEEYAKLIEEIEFYSEQYLFEDMEDNFTNVYRGQQGNGYYIAGSNTARVDFIYGTDDEGNDIVMRCLFDELLDVGEVLVKAYVD